MFGRGSAVTCPMCQKEEEAGNNLITWQRLAALMVKHQVIDADALDDPEGYDGGRTMAALGRVRAYKEGKP